MKKKIYLDYAATTPIDPEVLKEMLVYFKTHFGNPSSIHSSGQKAQMAIDQAREKVARFLNCSCFEVVFTGSATEANNLAIFGVIQALKKKKDKLHIVTTQIEHHSVLALCEKLEQEGIEITYLPINKKGLVKVSEVKKAIKENTVLVSIMYANNEIGTIQPIAKIGKLIEKIKVSSFSSKKRSSKLDIFFHTDAVQAANFLDCNVKKLKVDLLTLSAHKIYGPKGVGVLYIKEGTLINPIIYGGGQEGGKRSGTENVAGIVGLGVAIEKIITSRLEIPRIQHLRDKLIEGILNKIPGSKLNGSWENRLPNNVNISIAGVEGESMVIALDQEGIEVSTGSACSSKDLEPSHVLLALGLSHQQAHGSLRLTLGKYTTEEEINKVLKILPKVIKRLRKISPF